jgi:hypothetical protein
MMEQNESSPTDRWRNLLQIFASVADDQQQRLEEEASYFGTDPEEVARELCRLDPKKAAKLFAEENPDLDLNKLQPGNLNPKLEYEVAVALLQLLFD